MIKTIFSLANSIAKYAQAHSDALVILPLLSSKDANRFISRKESKEMKPMN